jgi:hypothetical protein
MAVTSAPSALANMIAKCPRPELELLLPICTSNPDYGNLLAWSAAVSYQRRVDSQSGTEHRRHNVTFNCIRNRKDESLMNTNMTRITSPSFISIGIICIIRIHLMWAVILIIAFTLTSIKLPSGRIQFDSRDMTKLVLRLLLYRQL